jgi:hypothetical protein
MEGDGPMGKLTSLRKGLEGDGGDGGEAERLRILELNRVEEERGYDEESDDEKLPMPELVGAEKERGWDCESILSESAFDASPLCLLLVADSVRFTTSQVPIPRSRTTPA